MSPDKFGNVALVNRDTGEDLVTGTVSAREIFLAASEAVDGKPLYVLKDDYDGKVAKAPDEKGHKPSKPEPTPSLA